MRLDVPLGPGKLIVQIEPDIALVAGLGAHQLRILMKVVGEGLAENTPVSLMGTLWLDGAGPASYLGAWTTEEQVALRTFPVGYKMVASLTDEQLAAIERQRDGREIAFRIDVNASLSGAEGWPTGTVQGTLRIPTSQWLQQLEAVGAAASLTIVVSAPLMEGDRQQMGVRLRESRDAINDGRYGQAVATARMALDTSRKRDQLATPSSYKDKNAKLRSVHERWSALHEALYQLTHVPHHDDDVTAGAEWSRADAVAVLAVTYALIARQD
jgi:hypothetical protein